MENIILVLHFLIGLTMIGLILLQRGKGAEMGASFGGGGSNTVFGSSGGLSFFAKATAVLATLFFVTSFALAMMARNDASVGSGESELPFMQEETAPASGESAPASGQEGGAQQEEGSQEVPAAPGSDSESNPDSGSGGEVPSAPPAGE